MLPIYKAITNQKPTHPYSKTIVPAQDYAENEIAPDGTDSGTRNFCGTSFRLHSKNPKNLFVFPGSLRKSGRKPYLKPEPDNSPVAILTDARFCVTIRKKQRPISVRRSGIGGKQALKQIILTGDRPTGRLHVGHYVGSLKERVRLQNSGKFDEIYIMIADAQALTDNAEHPEKVRQNIIEVALDYLACGLDPAKSTIFIQSMVPELTELTFYYMNLVTVSRVQRNPTVKSEIQMRNFEASIPVGFFCYPISQAADITAFRATAVPVGEDQLPMLEQCKEIVHKFNTVYGETLTEPQIILPSNQACLRLPGIDGKAKMSKSLGNCIYLSDEPDEIKTKIMSMFTDPTHLRRDDPGHTEGNPVFTYLDAFCKPEHFAAFLPEYSDLEELKAHYRRGGLGDVTVKKFLNNVMQSELQPIRERRKDWQTRLPEVYEILKAGSETARKKAASTLHDVRHAMRIDYFESGNLLP